eukprot:gene8502-5969_t
MNVFNNNFWGHLGNKGNRLPKHLFDQQAFATRSSFLCILEQTSHLHLLADKLIMNDQQVSPSQRVQDLCRLLGKERYQCSMNCYRCIRRKDTIWTCGTCFHIFHMQCIKLWPLPIILVSVDKYRILFQIRDSHLTHAVRLVAKNMGHARIHVPYNAILGHALHARFEKDQSIAHVDPAHTHTHVVKMIPRERVRRPCSKVCHSGECDIYLPQRRLPTMPNTKEKRALILFHHALAPAINGYLAADTSAENGATLENALHAHCAIRFIPVAIRVLYRAIKDAAPHAWLRFRLFLLVVVERLYQIPLHYHVVPFLLFVRSLVSWFENVAIPALITLVEAPCGLSIIVSTSAPESAMLAHVQKLENPVSYSVAKNVNIAFILCTQKVRVTCPCGRNTFFEKCSVAKRKYSKIEKIDEESFVGVLECNDNCLFHSRLEALSARKKSVEEDQFIFLVSLYELGVDDPTYVTQIESKLRSFIQDNTGYEVMALPPASRNRRELVHLLARYYRIDVTSEDSGKQRSCVLRKTPYSTSPRVCLSQQLSKGLGNPRRFISTCIEKNLKQNQILTNSRHTTVVNALVTLLGSFTFTKPENDECYYCLYFVSRGKREDACSLLRQQNISFIRGASIKRVIPSMTARKHEGVFVDVEDIKEWSAYHIFDVRFDLKNPNSGKVSYLKGHIPGSIFVDLDNELCGTITPEAGRHPLPKAEKFVEWCKSRGISNTPVLCYDDMSGAMGAARLWWMLDSLGVEVYVLNGGYSAYKNGQLPIETTAVDKPISSSFWAFSSDFQHHYTINEIPVNSILVDARDNARFSSTVRPCAVDTLPGHIFGAKNLPFLSHLLANNGFQVLRDREVLRSNILSTLKGAWGSGAPDLSSCVFYCGSGVTGCFNIAVVNHVGLGKPFLYCGSWSQYSVVYRIPLIRQIIFSEGFFCEMIGPNLCQNKKVNPDLMTVFMKRSFRHYLNFIKVRSVVYTIAAEGPCTLEYLPSVFLLFRNQPLLGKHVSVVMSPPYNRHEWDNSSLCEDDCIVIIPSSILLEVPKAHNKKLNSRPHK